MGLRESTKIVGEYGLEMRWRDVHARHDISGDEPPEATGSYAGCAEQVILFFRIWHYGIGQIPKIEGCAALLV